MRQGEAHEACFAKFRSALEGGAPYVIVDNTNTQMWEYVKFLQLAQEKSYPTRVVEIECQDEATVHMFNE